MVSAKSNGGSVKRPAWAYTEVLFLSLLVLGGANWGVTALRLLTDRNRVCPHDLLQLMRSPWWLQFVVYLLVFIATVWIIVHLGVFKIERHDFSSFSKAKAL